MEIEPKIYASNLGHESTGLMIHIINLTSSNTSVGSSNTGKIRTFWENKYTHFSNDVDTVTITITSPNNDSWGRYFNETLTSAGLESGTHFNITTIPPYTERIEITGPGSTEDIYLSIYETKIKSNAE